MASDKKTRESTNLSLDPVRKLRGIAVARELGYELSGFVDEILQRAWEELKRTPRKRRGDHLQITLFDKVTAPEPQPATDTKKPRSK